MRIQGTAAALAPASSSAAKRAASGAFSFDGESATRAATATSGMRSIGGIDALLALQGVEEPSERRRKAVKRGRSALDALDALKLGLLSGTFDTGALARLKSVTAALTEPSGDAVLDAVLAEIELRAQVELAKIGMPESGPKEPI